MGNSLARDLAVQRRPVHPHVHGELSSHARSIARARGSSPRAWGTRDFHFFHNPPLRFIPTCMGNSIPPSRPAPMKAVHPHVHGELIFSTSSSVNIIGSSPRAWGTPGLSPALPPVFRFIPTCMGNSYKYCRRSHLQQVHPHVHGELTLCGDLLPGRNGSSPRAWGTRARR